MRTTDADVLNASYDQYVGRVIPAYLMSASKVCRR